MSHRFAAPLAAFGLAALLPACGGGGDCQVTVYSGRSEELLNPVLEDFAESSGIDICVRTGDSVDLALSLGEQGDDAEADVFISQSPGPVSYLADRGQLEALPAEILDQVPEGATGSDGNWVGFSGRKRVLVYNTDNVDPAELPTSVLDLTDSAYEGRVGIAPSNASFEDWFTILRVEQGDEVASTWLDGMVANGARSYPNNRAIAEAVGRGEIDFGLVNHYYNEQLKAQLGDDQRAENHSFADDDIGSLVLVTSASILTGANDRAAAEELIAYLLSEDAQRFFTESSFEYPLAAGVEPNPALSPLTGRQLSSVDLSELGERFAETTDMIVASGILNQ
jgi:iron(III) transport system substrate-binding protein